MTWTRSSSYRSPGRHGPQSMGEIVDDLVAKGELLGTDKYQEMRRNLAAISEIDL